MRKAINDLGWDALIGLYGEFFVCLYAGYVIEELDCLVSLSEIHIEWDKEGV